MYDLYVGIAGLKIKMVCKYPYAKKLCADFEIDPADADMTVSVTDDEINAERALYGDRPFSEGYCEGICLYRAIAERLPEFDGFVFHGAAVTVCGKGTVFAAPSGTGKTTHISLLLNNFPDDVKMINGDKPIIRKVNGEWLICSTPWAGKEGWKINGSARLSSIVLVDRAVENSVERVAPEENFDEVIRQVYIPKGADARFTTLSLVDEMARAVDFYRLECNMDNSAAKCSFDALK